MRRPGVAVSLITSDIADALFIVLVLTINTAIYPAMPLDPVLTALLVPVITAVIAIPITPSGLGIRENLFVYLLCAPVVGINATAALSLSLLAYGGSLAWSLVGGVLYLTFRHRHHLAEVAAEATPAIEADLRSLVTGLEKPESLPVQTTGDTAQVTVPGGHHVRLKRDGGVWRVDDFD